MRSLPGWSRVALATVCAGCAAAPLTPLPSPTNPLPLHGEMAAWDEHRRVIVMVGGSSPDRKPLRGTWEWSGQWRQAADSASSPRFAVAAIGYDAAGQRTILYTIDAFANRQPSRCSTWSYAGRAWTRLNEGACLTSRYRSLAMSASPGRSLVLADGPSLPGDTALMPLRIWALEGSLWVLVDSAGPRRTGFGRIAYDRSRRRLVVPVLFGGPDAGVWEFDGRAWSHITPDSSPSIRQTYGLEYDAGVSHVIIAGGQGTTRGPYYDDFWSWDGRAWRPVATGSPVPPGRGGGQFLIDSPTATWIYFSGYDTGPLRDLWVRSSGLWRQVDGH